MDIKQWGVLLVEIERSRRKMHEITAREPHNHRKLIRASQHLDKLINEYHKSKAETRGTMHF